MILVYLNYKFNDDIPLSSSLGLPVADLFNFLSNRHDREVSDVDGALSGASFDVFAGFPSRSPLALAIALPETLIAVSHPYLDQ